MTVAAAFNHKLIIKIDIYYASVLTSFVKRETFLAQLFLW